MMLGSGFVGVLLSAMSAVVLFLLIIKRERRYYALCTFICLLGGYLGIAFLSAASYLYDYGPGYYGAEDFWFVFVPTVVGICVFCLGIHLVLGRKQTPGVLFVLLNVLFFYKKLCALPAEEYAALTWEYDFYRQAWLRTVCILGALAVCGAALLFLDRPQKGAEAFLADGLCGANASDGTKQNGDGAAEGPLRNRPGQGRTVLLTGGLAAAGLVVYLVGIYF